MRKALRIFRSERTLLPTLLGIMGDASWINSVSAPLLLTIQHAWRFSGGIILGTICCVETRLSGWIQLCFIFRHTNISHMTLLVRRSRVQNLRVSRDITSLVPCLSPRRTTENCSNIRNSSQTPNFCRPTRSCKPFQPAL